MLPQLLAVEARRSRGLRLLEAVFGVDQLCGQLLPEVSMALLLRCDLDEAVSGVDGA